jgi:hypothetical protein
VEKDPQMETIQVVLDAELLRAADLAAKRQKVNRSALIREALERHLKRLHELELETQDRRATWLIRSAAKNTACGGTRRRGPSIKPRRCPSVRIREAGQTAAGSDSNQGQLDRLLGDCDHSPDYLHDSRRAFRSDSKCGRWDEERLFDQSAQHHYR